MTRLELWNKVFPDCEYSPVDIVDSAECGPLDPCSLENGYECGASNIHGKAISCYECAKRFWNQNVRLEGIENG